MNFVLCVFLLLVILFSLFVAYLLNVHIPSKWPEPWKLRFIVLAPLRLINILTAFLTPFWGPHIYFILIKKYYQIISRHMPAPMSEKYVKVGPRDFSGVPVLLYEPQDVRCTRRAVFYIHGGGFVFGDASNKYPDHFEDCIKAYKHFTQMADELGFDSNRIAVAGDNAGGNLAAALSLYLRDTDYSPIPKLLILITPCLQAVDFNSPSYNKYKNDSSLTRRNMAGYWLMYASGHIDKKILDAMICNKHTTVKQELYSDDICLSKDSIFSAKHNTEHEPVWHEIKHTFLDPYFAPFMAKSLKNLPKTYIMTVEQDVIRDDGIWYAQRLSEAGNDVTHVHHIHALHGMPIYINILKGSMNMFTQMFLFMIEKL